ncbi:hypothetical protein [Haladaptatus salinisoli]|uniref:hypothetical protein n=1 Tax=Haladaptatus salinisoli TaxID=2884876 RepID=UPI001D0B7775|nr:hypothetical protein [Haladaptatus salinisoli]
MATNDRDERERAAEDEQAPEDERVSKGDRATADEQASEGERALRECERCGESFLSVYIEDGACPQCRGE